MKIYTLLILILAGCSTTSDLQKELRSQEDYNWCVLSYKCANDTKNLDQMTEKEKEERYNCRLNRHIKCSTPGVF